MNTTLGFIIIMIVVVVVWGGGGVSLQDVLSQKKRKKKKDAKDHAQGCISRAKPEIGIRTVSPPGLALQGSVMGRCWGGWGFV